MNQYEQREIARSLDQRGILMAASWEKRLIGSFNAHLYKNALTITQELSLIDIFERYRFRFPELWNKYQEKIARIKFNQIPRDPIREKK